MPLLACLPCPAAEPVPGLTPIYLNTNGPVSRLTTLLEKNQSNPPVAFRAICTNEWWPGLVPVFAVQDEERFELRRRSVRGQENFSGPLFFALPNADEPEAGRVAGRWDIIAIRGDGAKEYLGWEIAVEGTLLAGRFDQNTDYRFAHINGGTWRSNKFELRGEYISDAFVLTATWETNCLKGEWHRTDDSERGTWQATRPYPQFKPPGNAVPLYEWRNPEGKRRYMLESRIPSPGWQRAAKPLCRVWP